ncbi:MAG: AIR synthase-related protein, partial [Helicobacter sp.]|nr:AIR synthase-related protein [Helicobacter sp.]
QIPLLLEAIPFALDGIIPGGSCGNQKASERLCSFNISKDSPFFNLEILLFDAQTSGGLVFATTESQANRLLLALQNEGISDARIIGEVCARDLKNGGEKRIFVR